MKLKITTFDAMLEGSVQLFIQQDYKCYLFFWYNGHS